MDPADVRMFEFRQDACLAQEARASLVVQPVLRVDRLEGDLAVQRGVARQLDLAHALRGRVARGSRTSRGRLRLRRRTHRPRPQARMPHATKAGGCPRDPPSLDDSGDPADGGRVAGRVVPSAESRGSALPGPVHQLRVVRVDPPGRDRRARLRLYSYSIVLGGFVRRCCPPGRRTPGRTAASRTGLRTGSRPIERSRDTMAREVASSEPGFRVVEDDSRVGSRHRWSGLRCCRRPSSTELHGRRRSRPPIQPRRSRDRSGGTWTVERSQGPSPASLRSSQSGRSADRCRSRRGSVRRRRTPWCTDRASDQCGLLVGGRRSRRSPPPGSLSQPVGGLDWRRRSDRCSGWPRELRAPVVERNVRSVLLRHLDAEHQERSARSDRRVLSGGAALRPCLPLL